ncbi:MAG: hypothetical protein AB9856_01410 [Cellulosilyticaceae bacterium]
MGKKSQHSESPFPNLMDDWLEDGLTLQLSKLTGCDQTEYPIVNEDTSVHESILGIPKQTELTKLSSTIDDAISAFVQKHGASTVSSLDELLEQSTSQQTYEFAPKSFDSFDLDFLKKN